jgi:hypothetical protein
MARASPESSGDAMRARSLKRGSSCFLWTFINNPAYAPAWRAGAVATAAPSASQA